ncbi:hypothetical protein J2Z21_000972 [Streptomyces griseochromogenes]|uniref:Secreted protein n=1 Tax=Streptomyces griseochromogenes TaxID=68214 RepID=A0A1B1AUS2_9ACTN|nr:hypothetical protein [Streptomyces griseochromogenes]ANP50291.1 hypothetical protein AVL59_12275 [Streptomyces griseochromogenes]MBP2048048.1 hypothetical protein [Streptomyces griseochromogenes]
MTGAVPRLGAAALLAMTLLCAGAVPAVANGGLITVIDNSQKGTDSSETDSTLEIDRAGNANTGSGTAGSDHDGSAVEVVKAIFGVGEQDGDD